MAFYLLQEVKNKLYTQLEHFKIFFLAFLILQRQVCLTMLRSLFLSLTSKNDHRQKFTLIWIQIQSVTLKNINNNGGS